MKIFQRRSVFVVLALLIAITLQPVAASARSRCPVRIPDSLLTLYLKSDLVVVGSVKSEQALKKTQEYEYGAYFDVQKNLRVSETLKGRDADSAAFVVSQFKSKNAAENADEDAAYAMPEGGKALFFLTRDEEDGSFRLADVSGMKVLDEEALDVYVKRVKELERITTTAKKNQIEQFAEWLVRLAEEPATRDEGTIDLSGSFNALEYAREEEEEEDEAAKTDAPFELNKDFRASDAPQIAAVMTDTQKARLSAALLAAINEDVLKISGAREDDEEEISPDYRFISLVANWDKTYAAMNSFALLQNSGDAVPRRAAYLMEVVADFLDDEELYTTSGDYNSALSEPDDALTDDIKAEKTETVADATENAADSETENQSAAIENLQIVQVQMSSGTAVKAVEEPAAKITFKELREKLFARFLKQYGVVISRNAASE